MSFRLKNLVHNEDPLLIEPPMDTNAFMRLGLVCHMVNDDFCNNFLEYLWCQFLNIYVSANRRIHLSPLHAPRQGLNLFQNIRIQHLMVDDVRLGTFIRAAVVVGAEVNVHLSILELLSGQGQRMAAAVTEQQPPK